MKILTGSPFYVDRHFIENTPQAVKECETFITEYWHRQDMLIDGPPGTPNYCRELDDVLVKHYGHVDKTSRSVFDLCLAHRFFRTYVPYIEHVERHGLPLQVHDVLTTSVEITEILINNVVQEVLIHV